MCRNPSKTEFMSEKSFEYNQKLYDPRGSICSGVKTFIYTNTKEPTK